MNIQSSSSAQLIRKIGLAILYILGVLSIVATTSDDGGEDADTTDTESPSAFSLSAAAASPVSIDLSWTESIDNVSSVSYSVRRDGTPVASTADLSYQDTDLTADTMYCYVVVASDNSDNSTSSPEICATTLANTLAVTAIQPGTVVGAPDLQTISIIGSGFTSGSRVVLAYSNDDYYELPADKVSFVSSTQLDISLITGVDADTWTVYVENIELPEQRSESMTFNVVAAALEFEPTDGFDYATGLRTRYTLAADSDDWKVDRLHGEAAFGRYHLGEDWNFKDGGDSDLGMDVRVVANGTIVFAGEARKSGWGNVLVVRHMLPDGTFVESLYGHLNSIEIMNGQVSRGEVVGTIGQAPATTSVPDPLAHLHFEIRDELSTDWGVEGEGYSDGPQPIGSFTPSEYMDSNRPELTVFDGEFENWTSFTTVTDDPNAVTDGPGTSAGTVSRSDTGGNPGAYLATDTTVDYGDSLFSGAYKPNYLWDLGERPSAASIHYDLDDGAIENLSIYIDLAMFGDGSTGWYLVVEQDGQRFYSVPAAAFSGGWSSALRIQLSEADFDTNGYALVSGNPRSGQTPDFSGCGGPIRFGVSVSNSLGGPGSSQIAHGLDNFEVRINRAMTDPTRADCNAP